MHRDPRSTCLLYVARWMRCEREFPRRNFARPGTQAVPLCGEAAALESQAAALQCHRGYSQFPPFAGLAGKFGFPRETPVTASPKAIAASTSLATLIDENWSAKSVKAAKPGSSAVSAPNRAAPAVCAVTAAALAPAVAQQGASGAVICNDMCSRCHGTDGFTVSHGRSGWLATHVTCWSNMVRTLGFDLNSHRAICFAP